MLAFMTPQNLTFHTSFMIALQAIGWDGFRGLVFYFASQLMAFYVSYNARTFPFFCLDLRLFLFMLRLMFVLNILFGHILTKITTLACNI